MKRERRKCTRRDHFVVTLKIRREEEIRVTRVIRRVQGLGEERRGGKKRREIKITHYLLSRCILFPAASSSRPHTLHLLRALLRGLRAEVAARAGADLAAVNKILSSRGIIMEILFKVHLPATRPCYSKGEGERVENGKFRICRCFRKRFARDGGQGRRSKILSLLQKNAFTKRCPSQVRKESAIGSRKAGLDRRVMELSRFNSGILTGFGVQQVCI